MKFFKSHAALGKPDNLSLSEAVRKTTKKTLSFIRMNMRHFTVFRESSLEFVK
jgi:hypothetical protein